MSWLKNTMSALSQLVNAFALGGNQNETVSARCYRQGVLKGDSKWRKLRKRVDSLFFWEKHHCRESYKSDLMWAKAHVEEAERYAKTGLPVPITYGEVN